MTAKEKNKTDEKDFEEAKQIIEEHNKQIQEFQRIKEEYHRTLATGNETEFRIAILRQLDAIVEMISRQSWSFPIPPY